MIFLFKLIYYAVIAYIIYAAFRFIRKLGRGVRTESAKRPEARLSGTMVKDEACNTYIPKEEALREVIGGQEHFFCSKECRKKFLEERKGAG
jgi:uncharacterized protein